VSTYGRAEPREVLAELAATVGSDAPRLRALTAPAAAGPGANTPVRPAPRLATRPQPIYRGLPRPVRLATWIALAVTVGAVLGATAPSALRDIGAVAALRPGLLAWYSVRALGFLSYGVLAASFLYGLLLSTKILDVIAHRPVSFTLHKELALVGLGLAAVHGLLLIADESFSFSLRSIVVPFASPYAPGPVGMGQLGFYVTAVVTASFYVRRHIGQRAWRLVHYLSFLGFAGVAAHGILSGSDSGSEWAFGVYVVPIMAGSFLLTYRIVVGISGRIRPSRDPA
jgi:methionine sulfoxide reductase heme-binding subunit